MRRLGAFDESSTAVKTAVRHSTLLATVKNNSDSVSFFVLVHNAANVQAASLVLSSSQDASGSYTLSLGSLHIGRLLSSESALGHLRSILPTDPPHISTATKYLHGENEVWVSLREYLPRQAT